MDKSYLLLICDINRNTEVANSIKKLSGIDEAIPVNGVYDCIVKTKLSHDKLNELIVSFIRPMKNVRSILRLYDGPIQ